MHCVFIISVRGVDTVKTLIICNRRKLYLADKMSLLVYVY